MAEVRDGKQNFNKPKQNTKSTYTRLGILAFRPSFLETTQILKEANLKIIRTQCRRNRIKNLKSMKIQKPLNLNVLKTKPTSKKRAYRVFTRNFSSPSFGVKTRHLETPESGPEISAGDMREE